MLSPMVFQEDFLSQNLPHRKEKLLLKALPGNFKVGILH